MVVWLYSWGLYLSDQVIAKKQYQILFLILNLILNLILYLYLYLYLYFLFCIKKRGSLLTALHQKMYET